VSKEVADHLANTAEKLGMTQYALANQILDVGLELIRGRYGVAQIREIGLQRQDGNKHRGHCENHRQ
jgi:hypothetical protein